MLPFLTLADSNERNSQAAAVRHTMEGFLTELLGNAPKRITAVFVQNMILIRAFQPFPEAEARMVSNRKNDSLCQKYYDGLFGVSEPVLREELSRILGCGIQQIRHVLDPNAQELDIMIHFNHSSANNSNYTEE
jgi:uncharacterized protein YbcI